MELDSCYNVVLLEQNLPVHESVAGVVDDRGQERCQLVGQQNESVVVAYLCPGVDSPGPEGEDLEETQNLYSRDPPGPPLLGKVLEAAVASVSVTVLAYAAEGTDAQPDEAVDLYAAVELEEDADQNFAAESDKVVHAANERVVLYAAAEPDDTVPAAEQDESIDPEEDADPGDLALTDVRSCLPEHNLSSVLCNCLVLCHTREFDMEAALA